MPARGWEARARRSPPTSRSVSAMPSRVRPKLSYANVASTLALVLAMGTGGAYAANTIGSDDIIDGQVMAPDIAAGGVTWSKLAPDSVSSGKVQDNSLLATDL